MPARWTNRGDSLLVAPNKHTKKLESLQGLDKTYEGIIEIGKTTPSFDLETPFDSSSDYTHVTPQEIATAVEALTGDLELSKTYWSSSKLFCIINSNFSIGNY